jgi:hypothetical protein
LLTPTEQEVPYDYTELVNSKTGFDLPLLEGPAAPAIDPAFIAQMARTYGMNIPANALPAGSAAMLGGVLRKIKRSIDYRIIRNYTMKLEFLPDCEGRLPGNPPTCVKDLVGTVFYCNTCTHVTDYYAVDGNRHFLHPNVEVRLMIGNDDVTHFMKTYPRYGLKYFEVARRRRSWIAPLHSDNENAGPYRTPPGHQSGWIEDPTGAPGDGNPGQGWYTKPNWYDMPTTSPGAPSSWPRQRLVEEFLLGVKNFPEFGFLYYATVVDTKPPAGGQPAQYRVRKTQAERINEPKWCSILNSPSPRVDSTPVLNDSGWQPVR